MKEIQRYFGGVGKIDKAGKDRDSFSYIISSRKLITTVILPHFDLYPLITQKKADYELFKRIIDIMNNQEHLTDLGLQKIINLRASLNLGLSEGLKVAFPNTKPVTKTLVVFQCVACLALHNFITKYEKPIVQLVLWVKPNNKLIV